MLTWAAWGLILDIMGVLLIAATTIGVGVESSYSYLALRRGISRSRIAFRTKLLGWGLLLVGFGVQFVGEFYSR